VENENFKHIDPDEMLASLMLPLVALSQQNASFVSRQKRLFE
jgi:hypothetical protein